MRLCAVYTNSIFSEDQISIFSKKKKKSKVHKVFIYIPNLHSYVLLPDSLRARFWLTTISGSGPSRGFPVPKMAALRSDLAGAFTGAPDDRGNNFSLGRCAADSTKQPKKYDTLK